jgi:hypothetical protein
MPPLIYDGSGKAAPERVTLRAGILTAEYEAGMLRYLRLGHHELVRAIYAAVRDHNWGTIPAVLRDVRIDQTVSTFSVSFTSDHSADTQQFTWRGTIDGSADGTITFSFDGAAVSDCSTNRVGFCVLHPMEVAGQPVHIEHMNGDHEAGSFPHAIAPHQPFFDIRAITHEVIPGISAEVRMEGDTFEMEDQRNWTDASFKTYCTPLALPFPRLIRASETVAQKITVRLIGDVSQFQAGETAPTLHLHPAGAVQLPAIGVCAASDYTPLTEREHERLRALHLSHLRLDWRGPLDADSALLEQARQAADAGYAVELAVHLGDDPLADIAHFASTAEALQLKVKHWLIYQDRRTTIAREALQSALERLKALSDSPAGSGTDAFFAELNRQRPPGALIEWVAYSVNPQVHAFDNDSLIETLPAQAAAVESARQLFPACRVAVTPITLKMRWNPNATAAEPPTPPGQLPRQVDARQMSLFGAGWTMGAIASMTLAGADSLTFYETTGWLGVMEREGGSPLPDLFPSVAGGVFPLYHIFADVGELGSTAEVLPFTTSQPLKVSGLALRTASKRRLLVANHSPTRQDILITGVSSTFTQKALDEHSADFALRDPEGYRSDPGTRITSSEDGLRVALSPYAIVRLDQDIEP